MNTITPFLPYIYASVPAIGVATYIVDMFTQNELADEKLIRNTPNEIFVKEHTEKVAQKMGFTKPIRIARSWTPANPLANGRFHAVGSAILPGRCGFTTPYLEYIPRSEIEVAIAHELSHIQANDEITMPLVDLIVGVAVGILLGYLDFSSTAAFVAGCIAFVIEAPIVSRWREREADRNAMKYCSEKAKKNMLALLVESKEKGHDKRRHGFLLDILQPTVDDKIKIINESLESESKKD